MRRALLRRVCVGALALLVGMTGAACSGDSEKPESDAPASSSAPAPELQTRSWLGEVAGRLPPRKRAPVVRAVTSVVQEWTDAAYLAGEYPRTSFRAFSGFTPGARRQAVRDAALMSNADIGDRVEGVTPVRRAVAVDVLAHRSRAVGATARVLLRFDTTGEVERRVTVRGRLMLTRAGDGGWKVFAYDMSKGAR